MLYWWEKKREDIIREGERKRDRIECIVEKKKESDRKRACDFGERDKES